MKYVNFNSISVKNFLSVGNEPVVVDFNTGLNIITGHNKDKLDRRNGVGKSTIADAIYFAIFGSTLRELKKDFIINNTNQRDCVIELNFTVNVDGISNEYTIRRTLSPTKCILYCNEVDITRDSIANTTEYICDLLHTTPEVFQNCVIMTVNNAVPFMAKKKLEKRKFIEGIFNLQVFSNMLNTVRGEYNTISKELDIECAKYEEISNNVNTLNEQKQTIENEKLRSKQKLQNRLDICKKEIKDKKDALSKIDEISITGVAEGITKTEDILTEIETKIPRIITSKSKSTALIEIKNEKYNKLESDHDECPVCLSKLNKEHKDIIEDEKQRIKKEIDELISKKQSTDNKLKQAKELQQQLKLKKRKLTDKLNEANLQKSNISNIKQQIQQLESQSKDIVDDISSINSSDHTFDTNIRETEEKLNKTQQGIDNIKKELSKLEIIKFIVSEEGVKSYIVKKILQLLNSKLSYYLKKMDSNCICVFNEYFEEEIIDEKGKTCSYFNFSGAERKNIDLACLFAFMDIRRLQGDVAFNFSIYDELFDSSLDERGVELVIDILKENIEKYKECVMVISHRKESTKLATGEIIFLEKQNGITTRVEPPETELK